MIFSCQKKIEYFPCGTHEKHFALCIEDTLILSILNLLEVFGWIGDGITVIQETMITFGSQH